MNPDPIWQKTLLAWIDDQWIAPQNSIVNKQFSNIYSNAIQNVSNQLWNVRLKYLFSEGNKSIRKNPFIHNQLNQFPIQLSVFCAQELQGRLYAVSHPITKYIFFENATNTSHVESLLSAFRKRNKSISSKSTWSLAKKLWTRKSS